MDLRIAEVGRQFRENFGEGPEEPKILVREGMVVEEVIHEVDAGAYDLLVLGHHITEHGDLHQDLTERMIFWCPIPVLVVQPRKVGARAEV